MANVNNYLMMWSSPHPQHPSNPNGFFFFSPPCLNGLPFPSALSLLAAVFVFLLFVVVLSCCL
jgi:hypothetical protein